MFLVFSSISSTDDSDDDEEEEEEEEEGGGGGGVRFLVDERRLGMMSLRKDLAIIPTIVRYIA